MAAGDRVVRTQGDLGRILVPRTIRGHVLGDVHDHRTRPPALGDVERLAKRARERARVLHEVVVLDAGPGDAHAVDFLERVAPDRVTRHLTGDHHHRRGVHVGGGDAGHRVGRSRAGGHEHDAGPARHPRIAVRHVGRALLVAHQDVLDVLLLVQRIVDVKDRAPGISEYVPNPVVLEKPDHDLRACQLHLAHLSSAARRPGTGPAIAGRGGAPCQPSRRRPRVARQGSRNGLVRQPPARSGNPRHSRGNGFGI